MRYKPAEQEPRTTAQQLQEQGPMVYVKLSTGKYILHHDNECGIMGQRVRYTTFAAERLMRKVDLYKGATLELCIKAKRNND